MAAATPAAKALASSQDAFGRRGTTTCRPLPPDVLTKLIKAEALEIIAHVDRTLDDSVPADALSRIEVEDEAIGLLRILQRGAPWMDLENAGLHQSEKATEVSDRHCLVIAHADALDQILIEARPGVFLEEALLLRTAWATQERQRPVHDLRQDPIGNLGIELSEPELGDALILPQDPVGVGETGLLKDRGPGVCGGRGLHGRLPHNLAGILVLAQALERALPDHAVMRPPTELNFGNELRPDPLYTTTGSSRELAAQRAKRSSPSR